MTQAITLADVLAATGGQVAAAHATSFSRVGTDTRTLATGDLFVAILGNRFDGHAFLAEAHARGAAGAIVSRDAPAPAGLTLVRVGDTRRALGDLARHRRSASRIPLVAITGSNGKTTTKDLCAAILAEAGPTLATEGNFNNEIGLPLTLLRLGPEHRYAVVELGMNAPGEIAALARIARPDVGVVTNVGPAHVGRLGSIDAIARAKGELLRALGPGGCAIFPGDDARLAAEAEHLPAAARVRFGERDGDEARLIAVEPFGRDGQRVRLRLGGIEFAARIALPGRHNALNALAAAAAARALGVDAAKIAAGLERARFSPHRSRLVALAGRTVLDDCYNANPASMVAALAAIAELRRDGGRLTPRGGTCGAAAVLGEMRELGDEAARLHTEVGAAVAVAGLDLLVCVGDAAAAIADGAVAAGMPVARVVRVADAAAAADAVRARTHPGDLVLVKGSRGARLEEVLANLEREGS
ncbi:MAG: UDP-N-acetylmuramoyl-tripeptide--D-alanyl-D-alanine ligase [Myxococcota bacterium]